MKAWVDTLPPINLYNYKIKREYTMDNSQELLSNITVFNKYAKYVDKLERRETWAELVDRNLDMHVRKYPDFKEEIVAAYKFVYVVYSLVGDLSN